MSYTSWFEAHAAKHRALVERLRARGLDREQIIAYFDFDNMVQSEPDFCSMYAKTGSDGRRGKRCHDLEPLNCYLCACPFFRFSDEGFREEGGKTQHSYCSVQSKHGRQGTYGDKIHQDCSDCTVPHRKGYVRRHYDVEWSQIMRKCHK